MEWHGLLAEGYRFLLDQGGFCLLINWFTALVG
jgi:hypothetical protein